MNHLPIFFKGVSLQLEQTYKILISIESVKYLWTISGTMERN